jgi:hypothetical protein
MRMRRMFQVKRLAVLVATAAVWPSGAYAMPDYPSSAESQAAPAVDARQDLRSPDTRDAARPAVSVAQDLRSPDAREAARATEVAGVEQPAVLAVRPAASASDGFAWGDAGIGAAGMLAVLTLASGTLLLAGKTRQGTPTA